MSKGTRTRRAGGAAISAVLVGLLVVGMVGASPATSASTVTLWQAESSCGAPAPGHAACLAMHLVPHTVPVADAARARAAGFASRPDNASGLAGGYTPTQIAKAYGSNPAAKAGNRVVGIVDAFNDPTVLSDLNAFDNHYGLPAETASSFKVLNQNGAASPLPLADNNWASEITLDVQAVRGLCNSCRIVLIEANSASYPDLGAGTDQAVAQGAEQVSLSFGGGEGVGIPQQPGFDHPGVALLASTGDEGFYDWDFVNGGAGTPSGQSQTPASYPTVIGVGGTSLYLQDDGARADETAWNENGPSDLTGQARKVNAGAGGSGCSASFDAQTWQAKVASYAGLGCAPGKRSEVDIAADADPYTGYDVFQTYPQASGSWQTYGGTSLAAPLVSALWATAGGPGNVAYPALSLYGHFASTPSSVHDITVGGTGFCGTSSTTRCALQYGGSPNVITGYPDLDCSFAADGSAVLTNRYQCNARTGYDGVSGVGTPASPTLFKPMSPTAVITVGKVVHKKAAAFSGAGSKDPFPGGTIASYAWSFGDGTTSTAAKPHHTYKQKGKETVRLTVTDSYGRSATVSKKLAVG